MADELKTSIHVIPTVNMLLRSATFADAADIARIQVKGWKVAYKGILPESELACLDIDDRKRFWRRRLMEMPGVVFVAQNSEEIAGFCDLLPVRSDEPNTVDPLEIMAIYISPQQWRRGIGRLFLQRALVYAEQEGYRNIILWVLLANLPARKFYEAFGFREDGAQKTETMMDRSRIPELRYRIAAGVGEVSRG
jgi:RimJ/RimL family protein N-acetyltransferase